MSEFNTPLPRKKKAQITQEDALNKIKEEWDFEKLLEPYKESGHVDMPVERNWGTIISWLVNTYKFPPDIVGAGIFLVWMKIKRDGHFKGDGKYGSPGREFVHAIRTMCASVMQERVTKKIFSGMAGKIEQQIKSAFVSDFWAMMPWFIKMFSFKYWKHKIVRMKVRHGRMADRMQG